MLSAEHLPALQVVVPLAAAPLIVLLRRPGVAWAIATAVSVFAFACSVMLAWRVAADGAISYELGSWAPPWGIEYRVDALSAFVLVLVASIGAVAALYARRSIAAELSEDQHYLFYTMFVLCLAGLLGMTITGDAFNLFVFMEVSSLSMYVLIALGRHRRALMAAFQYLILGTVGATCFVIGVGLLYLSTGTLNLVDLAERVQQVKDLRPILAALAFLTVGMSLKAAVFPLHLWLPNAYTYAPSVVSAFLAATATKVAIYVLIRFYFTVFGERLVLEALPMSEILIALSVLAIVTASLVAVFQSDLKRMFAYSSVAQIGYIPLGIGLANAPGLTAATVHLFNHGITKGAIFMLLGCLALRAGRTGFDCAAGLARSMPFTAFGMVIAGLSLIGVPGTAGFISKWYLVLGAIELGQWWLVALVVATSLIAVAYVWRFVEAAYLTEPTSASPRAGEAPLAFLLPAWALVAACVVFGFETAFSVGGARAAATMLLGGGP